MEMHQWSGWIGADTLRVIGIAVVLLSLAAVLIWWGHVDDRSGAWVAYERPGSDDVVMRRMVDGKWEYRKATNEERYDLWAQRVM